MQGDNQVKVVVEQAKVIEPSSYHIDPEDYNKAIRGCGPYALRRLYRKMIKLKRHAPIYSNAQGWHQPFGPAKDLERYVFNFVETHKNKPPVREISERE